MPVCFCSKGKGSKRSRGVVERVGVVRGRGVVWCVGCRGFIGCVGCSGVVGCSRGWHMNRSCLKIYTKNYGLDCQKMAINESNEDTRIICILFLPKKSDY